ncbi:MAG: hypothetical protein PWQ51_111 [Methanolobus sp.]|jgi:hypothetical protein|uniref:Uncharacterized protein n=1 Tax=Methanolobus tindarius DSM 2278 TaxID=1090322 RepID=W9DW67_METTI|nr:MULTISPECIES: hypothetical protein [Methanolobus]ETA67937.1 hypothetical protein MettiDRAFT_1378 [Methanolobus tindarius DSM 2278]MDI3485816.1 hypothetical protein [Methanolobus sp.]MDK2831164.1 hypothetical protein [Methanolobus sp.]MDK2937947.1 hypothetical protein [Methanolobus sp.]
MTETFTLGIGERRNISKSFLGNIIDMMYCGMSSENTFSMGLLFSKGYQGHALNLYYPRKSSSIVLNKQKYYVVDVNSEYITLQLSN